MKYYIIAGEASGDLHGSNLIFALKKNDTNAIVQAWGGDLMEQAGAKIVRHYKDLAFMGFVEVVKNLPTILSNFKFCKIDILQFKPDVLILIDYPGFNLRMAKWAKKNGIRVFYYISPQLWAWNTGRAKIIEKNVERMYVILPFEKLFYEKYGIEVDYVGHPLMEMVQGFQPDNDFFPKNNLDRKKSIIALLPGSRKQEIKRMLRMMLSVVEFFPTHQFVIAGAPAIERSFYEPFFENNNSINLVENDTYNLLYYSKAALVTSGTATLETALFKVPQVVCYSGNWLSFQLAKRLVNKDLKFIALANLIADKEVIKELIQDDFTTSNLKKELENCLTEKKRVGILKGYDLIQEKLKLGGASERTANLMVQRLHSASSTPSAGST